MLNRIIRFSLDNRLVVVIVAVLLVTAATVTFCSWRTANENPADSVKSE